MSWWNRELNIWHVSRRPGFSGEPLDGKRCRLVGKLLFQVSVSQRRAIWMVTLTPPGRRKFVVSRAFAGREFSCGSNSNRGEIILPNTPQGGGQLCPPSTEAWHTVWGFKERS